jgi:hypothetical protein
MDRARTAALGSLPRPPFSNGWVPAPVFGRITDRAFYDALLSGNTGLFTELADEMAETIISSGTTFVAGDALEGYNPAHDVFRMLLDKAVEVAAQRTGREIANHEFPLAGRPGAIANGAVVVELDDAGLARKLDAALSYGEMRQEIASVLARLGLEAFRSEYLIPRRSAEWAPSENPPFYEIYGEERVSLGLYRQVVRYAEHVAPLGEALRRSRPQLSALTPTRSTSANAPASDDPRSEITDRMFPHGFPQTA